MEEPNYERIQSGRIGGPLKKMERDERWKIQRTTTREPPRCPPQVRAQRSCARLPKDLARLCEIVQGVLVHRDIAPWLYDLKLTEAQRDDGNTRPLAKMLDRIHALDDRPLTIARDPAHRMPTVCRHFSLMLGGILREQGIPARARCGFGAYFNPGKFEDHWVCEYWNAQQSRWILVDAQMDAIQRKAFNAQASIRSMCRAINSSSRATRGSSVAPGALTRRTSASPISMSRGCGSSRATWCAISPRSIGWKRYRGTYGA